MNIASRCRRNLIAVVSLVSAPALFAQDTLPGTQRLVMSGDPVIEMVQGMARFFERESAASVSGRAPFWKTDTSSRAAYDRSVQPNRESLARIIGAVDPRIPNPDMEQVATVATPALVAETDRFTVHAVRWPVLDGVHGEGLLLQPKGRVVARVVALPDADQTPELIAGLAPGLDAGLQYARRLAENGVQVIVPALADRSDSFSGSPVTDRHTNMPHREWLYRQAYIMGRHVIGYEVQKIRSAVDWFERQNQGTRLAIGVAGWGEGGVLALYGGALDTRIDVVLVSGYFSRREQLWQEPIYRNLFGFLNEFGDAGLARLVMPRPLLVEHAEAPVVTGPPTARAGRRNAAAPGRITTPSFNDVSAEVELARQLAGPFGASIQLRHGPSNTTVGPLAGDTLSAFRQALAGQPGDLHASGSQPKDLRPAFDPRERQQRVVREMEGFTQRLWLLSSGMRENTFWKKLPVTTPESWREAVRPEREKFWNDVIGRFPAGSAPLNPRTRLLHVKPAYTAHEVMLDVLPDVFAWGYYLVPKGIKPGEKRPVVVAQHGLNSLPSDVINEDPASKHHHQFKAFGVRLVERGFIVFVPRNPYYGDDLHRSIQRRANPLGKSIFSIIVAQHDRILDWLSAQPNVDPARIGFYGLSYGGKTAMRVTAILERYAVSICSGDFNEWIGKNASTHWDRSYMFTNEYEMPEFNLGLTYSYAEMAALIAPRPFMVERGHNDGVGLDEWVAFEYAKVNRLYAKLRIPQRTQIEYFDGPHTIHGVGTYKFLHHYLNWPEPAGERR